MAADDDDDAAGDVKPKKSKQAKLEGFVAVEDKEIGEAVEQYVDIRDKRMKMTEKESAANQYLVTVLKKHKRRAVSIDGNLVEIIDSEKARVKRASKDKDE